MHDQHRLVVDRQLLLRRRVGVVRPCGLRRAAPSGRSAPTCGERPSDTKSRCARSFPILPSDTRGSVATRKGIVLPAAASFSLPPVCSSRSLVLTMYRSGRFEMVRTAASTLSLIDSTPASTSRTSVVACVHGDVAARARRACRPCRGPAESRPRRVLTDGIAGFHAQRALPVARLRAWDWTGSVVTRAPERRCSDESQQRGAHSRETMQFVGSLAALRLFAQHLRRAAGSSSSSRCTRDTSFRLRRASLRTASRTDR